MSRLSNYFINVIAAVAQLSGSTRLYYASGSRKLRRFCPIVFDSLEHGFCPPLKEQKLALGEIAPALVAYDLGGEKVSLQQWQGKPIFLTFWSSTCSGCLAEFPLLAKLNAQYGDKVSIVSVNTDRPEVDIAPLVEQYNLSFAVVRDQLGITQEHYEIIGTPTAFLLDRKGRIVAQYLGMQKEQQLTDIIKSAVVE